MSISTHESTVHKISYKISYSPLDGLHSFEASSKLALKNHIFAIFDEAAKLCKAFNDAYNCAG